VTDSVARATDGVTDPVALGFAPTDPGFIAHPYPVFDALREAGPVLYYQPRDLYLLPRFAEVFAALRDRKLGRAFEHRYTPEQFGRPGPDGRWPRFWESERWSLLNLEPPDHTRIRRLITKVFTARAIANLRPQISALSAAQLDTCLDAEDFDLIADYAQPYSVKVICTLLGVPISDGPHLLDWSHAIVKMYEFATPDSERAAADRAAGDFIDYVKTLIGRRRERPEGDLISDLVQVADAGDRLTEDEIVCTVIVLLNAGHEATVNTAGNGMKAMLAHPDQWDRVLSGEVAPLTAVEEMLRFDPPLQLFERWVLDEGVSYGGREFAVGERIGMMFGSANRDPARFPGADRFDVGRGDATHIGFGGGVHFCIGAPLARLELEITVDQLRHRAPALQVVTEPEYQPYFVIRGLRGLRVASA
jgi:unspecific monooxygenase